MFVALISLLVLWPIGSHYLQIGRNAVIRPITSDFFKFYLSAQRPDQGHSIYWLVPPREVAGDSCHPDTPSAAAKPDRTPGRLNLGGEAPCLGPNLNPPFFMVIMRPLSRLSYSDAWWTWAGMSALWGAISVWLMTGTAPQGFVRRAAQWVIGCTVLFCYYPSIGNHTLGQMGMLLLWLMTLAWHLKQRGRVLLSGMFLGLALGLKPFLLPLFACLLVTRQWRMLRATAVTVLLTLLAGGWLCGLQAYADYFQVANNVNWTATNWNASWTGLIDRYFIGTPDSLWPETRPVARALSFACSAATLAVLWRALRCPSQCSQAQRAEVMFILGPAACLLMSPLGWVYYFPMLALSWHLSWKSTLALPRGSQFRVGLLCVFAMQCMPIGILPSPSPLNPAVWYGVDAWFGFSLIVCFGVLASIALSNRTGNLKD